MRIVAVDDNLDAIELLAMALECDGYGVVAGDARQALATVERHRPHCVLLDVRMPGTDGHDFSRQLRELYVDDIVLVLTT